MDKGENESIGKSGQGSDKPPPSEPKEAFVDNGKEELLPKPGRKRFATWKMALVGSIVTIAVVVLVVGVAVAASGSSADNTSKDNQLQEETNDTLTPTNQTEAPGNDTQTKSNSTTISGTNNNTKTSTGAVSTTSSVAQQKSTITTTNITSTTSSVAAQTSTNTTRPPRTSSRIPTSTTIRSSTTLDPVTTKATTTTTTIMTTTTDKKTTLLTTRSTTTMMPTSGATRLVTLAPTTGNGGGGGNPTPQPTGGESSYQRTTIFLFETTVSGENLFMRGGISGNRRTCQTTLATDPCSIPIRYRTIPNTDHYKPYREWSQNDNYLNWGGAESSQGTHNGAAADGSPAVWTTNVQGANGYVALNRWGNHHWMLDVDMDCSKTESGWFDLKAFVAGRGGGTWETDRRQDITCTGSARGTRLYDQGNHLARCGKINKFIFNKNSCVIDNY